MNAAMAQLGTAPTTPDETAEVRLGGLFDGHQAELFRLALRMSADREAARDLVQDTFLRAARRIDRVPDDPGAARAWLFRVLVNLCRDRHRKQEVRRRAVEAGDVTCAEAAGHEEAEVARHTVRRALQMLPPRQRAMVVLCEMDGYSRAEVAKALGLQEVTVRWNLARARKRLAEFIEGNTP